MDGDLSLVLQIAQASAATAASLVAAVALMAKDSIPKLSPPTVHEHAPPGRVLSSGTAAKELHAIAPVCKCLAVGRRQRSYSNDSTHDLAT